MNGKYEGTTEWLRGQKIRLCDITSNQVINWTHNTISSRFEVNVGVDYSSDVGLMMKALKGAAEGKPLRLFIKPQLYLTRVLSDWRTSIRGS